MNRKNNPTNWAKGFASLKKSDILATIMLICDPGGIQTHDFRNRNPTFYSAELRGLVFIKTVLITFFCLNYCVQKIFFFTFSFSSTTNHLLFRVVKIGVCDFFQYFVEILCRLPLGHGEVVQQVIAAVFRGSTRHLALEVGHKPESLFH